MKLSIKQMNYDDAKQISKWIYEEPYSIYSMDGSDTCIAELLNGFYFSAFDDKNNLLGYYCFGESAQVPVGKQFGVYDNKAVIDIGLGIKPNSCGKGLGFDFLGDGLTFARKQLSTKGFRLTVATFNKRAIKIYENVGFRRVNSFKRISDTKEMEFYVLILS